MKLFISFFMPKQIGRFLYEKAHKLIIYFLLFAALAFIPYAVSLSKDIDIIYTDDITLFQSFKNTTGSNIKIEGNVLNDTESKEIYSGDLITVAFNTSEIENKSEITLVFYKESYDVYYMRQKALTIDYSNVGTTLDVSKLQAGDYSEARRLLVFVNTAYDKLASASSLFSYGSSFIGVIALLGIVVLFLSFSSSFFNMGIPFSIRIRIAVYSGSWAYLSYFIAMASKFMMIFYIGAIVSFIFNAIAIKQIVRVNKSNMEG